MGTGRSFKVNRFGLALLALLAALSLALPSLGDEIIFKNGDRLTGTITGADAGKVTINTTLAGPMSVPMSEIRTFSTDAPVTLKLRDGNVITDKIVRDETGMISVGGGGTIKRQSIALIDVAKINEPPAHWTGSIAVGGILTQGNSRTENFNANFDAVRRGEDDRITFDAGYFLGNQKAKAIPPATANRVTTTDNWFISGKYDYFFTKKFYGYGLAKVERDRIANLDLRLTPGIGVGYQWAESADFNFRTEAGATWVYEKHSHVPAGVDDTEDHVAVRLAYHVDKKLND
jgi:hypothetical protein